MSPDKKPDPLCKVGAGNLQARKSQKRAKLNQVVLESLPAIHPSKLERKIC